MATRDTDPDTSHRADETIEPKRTELQQKVLAYHMRRRKTGATDLDLENFYGTHRSTYRSRRAELTAEGLIRDSGKRKFQDGSNRVVWQAVA